MRTMMRTGIAFAPSRNASSPEDVPQSCRLYPIRITKLTGGGLAFNLHRWGICKDAFEKGRREGIRVYQFLKEPLTELYGEDFYRDLCAAAEYVIHSQEEQ